MNCKGDFLLTAAETDLRGKTRNLSREQLAKSHCLVKGSPCIACLPCYLTQTSDSAKLHWFQCFSISLGLGQLRASVLACAVPWTKQRFSVSCLLICLHQVCCYCNTDGFVKIIFQLIHYHKVVETEHILAIYYLLGTHIFFHKQEVIKCLFNLRKLCWKHSIKCSHL